MAEQRPDSREMGFYFALAQVGFEMVVPIGVGLVLNWWLGWGAWLVIVGAVLGLVGGLAHLVALLNRHEKDAKQQRPPDEQP
jgi:fatty acid desaturase